MCDAHQSDVCRWALLKELEDNSETDLVDLSPSCQLSRGMELLQLLNSQTSEPSQRSAAISLECSSPAETGSSFSYIVKNTFIDVLESPSTSRSRALTDSALVVYTPSHKDSNLVLSHLSDASTDASSEPDETVVERQPDIIAEEGFSYPDSYSWTDSWAQSAQVPDMWSAACYNNQHSAWSWADESCHQYEQVVEVPHYAPAYSSPPEHHVSAGEGKTTVMLRNLPNDYSRDDLLELLDRVGGFHGLYDLVYLPVDFKTQAGLGYAFINFVHSSHADECFRIFEGFSGWSLKSCKVCSVTWGNPLQGLQAHVERYRDSPVMHKSVPDDWKPILLQDGQRIEFPPPTKNIKPPKLRTRADARS